MGYEVMLAKIGSRETLSDKDYIFEPKFDGTRVLIYKKSKSIKLLNRRNRDITPRYPELESIWKNIKKDCVLDGELVVLNDKHLPEFNLLQKREQIENKTQIKLRSVEMPATIFVFDILELEGKKLTKLPLLERKKILKSVFSSSSKLSLTPYTTDGKALWKRIQKLKMEGVMAKRKSSQYLEGRRTDAWLKVKNTKTLDAIVIGYTQEKREISSLVLAAYDNKKLRYIGRVGTGFDEKMILHIAKELSPAKTPAIRGIKTSKKIHYVKPQMIVEVKYLEISKDKKLRAPVFLGIRNDKKKIDCII